MITVRQSPCSSCPYRRDVPSGIWATSEYAKLPPYDGQTWEQAETGATGLFFCHRTPDFLCAGWTGCHNMTDNLAMRLHARRQDVNPEVYDYVSPVPLFSSGAEAAAHGLRDISEPGGAAQAKARQLLQIVAQRNKGERDMTLVLETKGQADQSEVAPGLMLTPPVGNEDYWAYRVRLSAKQAIVGFPKFGTVGIGFAAEEDDWNTNLPYTAETEEIFQHIRRNKGDDAISDDDVRAAIRLVQRAARQDRDSR